MQRNNLTKKIQGTTKETKASARKDKDKDKEKPKEFSIDLDGIQNRVVALPMDPSNIRAFNAAKGYIYYSSSPIQGLSGPMPGESTESMLTI